MMISDDAKHSFIRQQMAGEEAQAEAKASEKGRLTARQRLARLFDGGEYRELFRFAREPYAKKWADGIVCGHGMVHGRPVIAYATEFHVSGGALGTLQTRQAAECIRLAAQSGIPVVSLWESGGAKISEAVHIMEGFVPPMAGTVFASGIVPQIACVFGHCIGAAAITAVLGDFVIMESQATMAVSGSRVNRMATGEDLTEEELGGVDVHNEYTGNTHFVCEGEDATIEQARELLRWLPANHAERPPQLTVQDPIERDCESIKKLIPADTSTPFDMTELIRDCADHGDFCEVQPNFAPNAITGFAAFGGQVMAVVGNQSTHLGGAMDPNACRKITRFLNFIANFNFPLLTLLDVPGALPTLDAQKQGILTHLAQIIHGLYHVRGLKITIVVRRCFGGTYALLSPKAGEGDIIFAYPSAMIGVMSDQAMTEVMQQNERMQAKADKLHAAGVRLDDPLLAAAALYLDDIIDPAETRREIVRALRSFSSKRVQHFPDKLLTNPPL